MKFKVDENLPIEVAGSLRQAGHDAATVWDQSFSGVPDRDIAAVCQTEGRALLALDLGFADIRTYPPERLPGLIVLRSQDRVHALPVVERLIHALSTQPLDRRLWIVDETHIRVRG
jgi:predicted nuclease of predicted toxin-antitoxin system